MIGARGRLTHLLSGAIVTSIALSACGGGAAPASLPTDGANHHRGGHHHSGSGSGPIQHIVLLIQENRTFNDLFAGFPGAVSSMTGQELVYDHGKLVEKPIALTEHNLLDKGNITHLYPAFLTAYQNGAMDGFSLIKFVQSGKKEGKAAYQYVNPAQIGPYWTIASQWGLADEMFQTQGSDSFTAHQDLIRGGTFVDPTDSLVDPPTSPEVWGCDAAPPTHTTLVTTSLQ
ncbi:MAG: hypothetical protein JO104_03270, partial [Candidatus Eremiobacteraeota bacterium]|nr:hypothetical protein [Candidatus Eremiobacteraeota bacterium]